MDANEIQARATIAAALILSRAVELPTMPRSADGRRDTAGPRLRELTDYIYQTITAPETSTDDRRPASPTHADAGSGAVEAGPPQER